MTDTSPPEAEAVRYWDQIRLEWYDGKRDLDVDELLCRGQQMRDELLALLAAERMGREEAEENLAAASRFITRFLIHDGVAKPYSVREGQLMLEQADCERDEARAEAVRRDGLLHRAWADVCGWNPDTGSVEITYERWLADLAARTEEEE